MQYFDHEKLDVYQKAIEFVVLIESIVKQFPKGRAYLIGTTNRFHVDQNGSNHFANAKRAGKRSRE
ncbi:MAG: four helix bundle protein [Legionella sp.]|uniref:four helix bundle protein n=1 Tax=Legionella sp. TaxID=459 RepID=UPI0039E53F84